MIAYASRTGTRRNLNALRSAGWRLLVSAKGVLRTENMPYALDNGAWSAFQAQEQFDEAAFLRALDRLGANADWIVIPDIVAGGVRSLDYSLSWLPRLTSLDVPLLLAVQDGMTPNLVRPLLNSRIGIFVGGSTDWKLATALQWGQVARAAGCWLHIGRVNTIKRIQLCAAAGADSFDGTSASRFSCTLRPLDLARRQPDMFAATGDNP